MKRIVFVLILLASNNLYSRGQQHIVGNGIMFTLPDEAVPVNSPSGPPMKGYKINDIILSFRDSSKKYYPNSLEVFKTERDDFHTKGESRLSPDQYTSYIKAYKHCSVAVYRIGDASGGSYHVYAVNKTETRYFIGHFDYNKGDLTKADAFLTDLLNSLEFTK